MGFVAATGANSLNAFVAGRELGGIPPVCFGEQIESKRLPGEK
jgi:hypothetical protein